MIPNIAIISTVINFDLYQKTSKCFPQEIPKIVIDGTNGMYGIDSILYMFKKIKHQDFDWIIMADEDVVFEDTSVVFEIIHYMENHNYIACGVQDGGVIAHRNYNPNVINTFFSILKFNEVKAIFDKKEILENQYCLPNEFSNANASFPYLYDENSLYEPYYCFYLWLLRKGKKILYLDSVMENDMIANALYFQEKKIATHTWYARAYGKDIHQTNRINSYLKVCENINKLKPKIHKSHTFKLRKRIKKVIQKFKSIMKIK